MFSKIVFELLIGFFILLILLSKKRYNVSHHSQCRSTFSMNVRLEYYLA